MVKRVQNRKSGGDKSDCDWGSLGPTGRASLSLETDVESVGGKAEFPSVASSPLASLFQSC